MNLQSAHKRELLLLIYKQERIIKEQEATINKQDKQIINLQQQITDLSEQIKLLKTKLKNHHKDNPPSFVKASTINKKTKKRKLRANGYARLKSKPDIQKVHMMSHCPHCGDKLKGKASVKYTRETIDVPQTPATVTKHLIMQKTCFSCGKTSWPEIKGVIGKGRFTVNVYSLVTTLKEELRIPVRMIKKYLSILHNLSISKGEIVKILHNTADAGTADYNDIKQKVRASPVVNADETGWRENGKNGYCWGFSTPKVRLFLYKQTRKGQIVEEVLGKDYMGVLVSDFYGGYNIHYGEHQRCWAHLLKDISQIAKLLPINQELQNFKKSMKTLHKAAKNYPNPDPTIRPYYKEKYQLKAQNIFKDKARTLYKPYLARKNHPLHTIAKRIDTFLPELFTFVANPQVPADNNAAERALRHVVISRKISGGTRSPKGSNTKEILSSLFGTWRLQEKNPLEECKNLLLNYASSY